MVTTPSLFAPPEPRIRFRPIPRSKAGQAAALARVPVAPVIPFAWSSDEVVTPTPAASWLYVSKRLDLEWLPNEPLWASPVIRMGETAYYRLSARTLVWLNVSGLSLERQWQADRLPRDQLNAYLEAMGTVWHFAGGRLNRDAVDVVRRAVKAGEVDVASLIPDVTACGPK